MNRIATILLAALGLIATSHVSAEPAPKQRTCTAAEKAAGDAALHTTPQQRTRYQAAHLPWGAPVSSPAADELLLVQPNYVNLYDASLRVPLWSAERLEKKQLGVIRGRINCFREDPRLSAEQNATDDDYKERHYDQGHLTPDADQEATVTDKVNTYLYSNMAPERCELNRGIWQILEGLTRLWAKEHSTLYVVSGTIWDRDGDGLRDPDNQAMRMKSDSGRSRVGIPSAIYKIVAKSNPGGVVSVLAIMLPHDSSNPKGQDALDYLQSHIVPLATLERLTELRFMPNATSVQQSTTLWAHTGRMPTSLCFPKKAKARKPA